MSPEAPVLDYRTQKMLARAFFLMTNLQNLGILYIKVPVRSHMLVCLFTEVYTFSYLHKL
jgi:hypothetical protein